MEQSELTPSAIPYFCLFCGKRTKTEDHCLKSGWSLAARSRVFSVHKPKETPRIRRSQRRWLSVATCEAKIADCDRRIAVLPGHILR